MLPRLEEKELPDLRLRMVEFMADHGTQWMPYMFQATNGADVDDLPTANEVRGFARSGCTALREGTLFYVDDALSDIALHSGVPLDEGFMPWDLPSKQGVVYYDHHCSGHEHDSDMVAANRCGMITAWNVHEPTQDRPHGHVDLFAFVHRDELQEMMERKFGPGVLGEQYNKLQPDYVLNDVVTVGFAPTGTELTFWAVADELQLYLRSLVATCHLMRQQLAETTTEQPDRPSRRRHQRAGLEPPQIRVARLRRSARPETTGESQREWRHRWIVRGHWRKQWYPSIEAHRPVWIAPFVKGPKEAPLLGGEKVYQVSEQREGAK